MSKVSEAYERSERASEEARAAASDYLRAVEEEAKANAPPEVPSFSKAFDAELPGLLAHISQIVTSANAENAEANAAYDKITDGGICRFEALAQVERLMLASATGGSFMTAKEALGHVLGAYELFKLKVLPADTPAPPVNVNVNNLAIAAALEWLKDFAERLRPGAPAEPPAATPSGVQPD